MTPPSTQLARTLPFPVTNENMPEIISGLPPVACQYILNS
jgi:hypothetical protein